MKDKNYITATQSVLMLRDHIDKKYYGNIMAFCYKTGHDIRNVTAMLNEGRQVSESVMSTFSKKVTIGGEKVLVKPKKHKSYYFTWEPSEG